MKRIVYYIIQGTAEQNQNGLLEYSRPIINLKEAKEEARKILNDFVGIEKHHEIMRGNRWEIDYNFEIEEVEF